MTTLTPEQQALLTRHTQQQSRQALVYSRTILENALKELDGYLQQFDQSEDTQQRARVMNWAINYLVSNLHGNLRIDQLANQQAELTRLAHEF